MEKKYKTIGTERCEKLYALYINKLLLLLLLLLSLYCLWVYLNGYWTRVSHINLSYVENCLTEYILLQAFGPRGMLVCDNERPMCGMVSEKGLRGALQEPIYFSFPSRYLLAYKHEMEHFLRVIDGTY